jgi:pyrroloquinoline quinone (PQQ) biosynthesis protein C
MSDKKVPTVANRGKLNAQERALVMMLLASGMNAREVSAEAKKHGVTISHQSVQRYYVPKLAKKTTGVIETLEDSAIKKGLAVKENRIAELTELYQLYVENGVKNSLKKGYSVDPYELREARAILNDIAKEMGDRQGAPAVAVQTNVNVSINQFAGALDRTYEVIDGNSAD